MMRLSATNWALLVAGALAALWGCDDRGDSVPPKAVRPDTAGGNAAGGSGLQAGDGGATDVGNTQGGAPIGGGGPSEPCMGLADAPSARSGVLVFDAAAPCSEGKALFATRGRLYWLVEQGGQWSIFTGLRDGSERKELLSSSEPISLFDVHDALVYQVQGTVFALSLDDSEAVPTKLDAPPGGCDALAGGLGNVYCHSSSGDMMRLPANGAPREVIATEMPATKSMVASGLELFLCDDSGRIFSLPVDGMEDHGAAKPPRYSLEFLGEGACQVVTQAPWTRFFARYRIDGMAYVSSPKPTISILSDDYGLGYADDVVFAGDGIANRVLAASDEPDGSSSLKLWGPFHFDPHVSFTSPTHVVSITADITGIFFWLDRRGRIYASTKGLPPAAPSRGGLAVSVDTTPQLRDLEQNEQAAFKIELDNFYDKLATDERQRRVCVLQAGFGSKDVSGTLVDRATSRAECEQVALDCQSGALHVYLKSAEFDFQGCSATGAEALACLASTASETTCATLFGGGQAPTSRACVSLKDKCPKIFTTISDNRRRSYGSVDGEPVNIDPSDQVWMLTRPTENVLFPTYGVLQLPASAGLPAQWLCVGEFATASNLSNLSVRACESSGGTPLALDFHFAHAHNEYRTPLGGPANGTVGGESVAWQVTNMGCSGLRCSAAFRAGDTEFRLLLDAIEGWKADVLKFSSSTLVRFGSAADDRGSVACGGAGTVTRVYDGDITGNDSYFYQVHIDALGVDSACPGVAVPGTLTAKFGD